MRIRAQSSVRRSRQTELPAEGRVDFLFVDGEPEAWLVAERHRVACNGHPSNYNVIEEKLRTIQGGGSGDAVGGQ